MLRKVVLLLIVTSIVVSCSGGFKWNNPEVASYWRRYKGEIFPDSLTSFFPINDQSKAKSFETIDLSSVEKTRAVYKNSEQARWFAENSPFFPYIMREVYIVNDEEEWNYWEHKAVKESSRSFFAGDTLNYFRITAEIDYAPHETVPGYITEGKEALPRFPLLLTLEFKGVFSKETPCFLPPDAVVFIMKSGHSCLLRTDRKPHPYAPDSMKHGYSSGVALKHPYLYFWASAW